MKLNNWKQPGKKNFSQRRQHLLQLSKGDQNLSSTVLCKRSIISELVTTLPDTAAGRPRFADADLASTPFKHVNVPFGCQATEQIVLMNPKHSDLLSTDYCTISLSNTNIIASSVAELRQHE